jgi:hypothetical protein
MFDFHRRMPVTFIRRAANRDALRLAGFVVSSSQP